MSRVHRLDYMQAFCRAVYLRELGVEEALGVRALRRGAVLDGEDLILVPEKQDLLPALYDHTALSPRERRQRHHR